jgi:hypothetical protein
MIPALVSLALAADPGTLRFHHPGWMPVTFPKVASALWISADSVTNEGADRAAFVVLTEDPVTCDELREAVASTDPDKLAQSRLLSHNRGLILVFIGSDERGSLPAWEGPYGGAGEVVSDEGHVSRAYSFFAWSTAGVVLPRSRAGGIATLTAVGPDAVRGHVENKIFDADFVATPCGTREGP